MRVNCLGCGHILNLGESYEDYCGQIRCNVCRSLMTMESEGGKLRTVKLEESVPPVESS